MFVEPGQVEPRGGRHSKCLENRGLPTWRRCLFSLRDLGEKESISDGHLTILAGQENRLPTWMQIWSLTLSRLRDDSPGDRSRRKALVTTSQRASLTLIFTVPETALAERHW